MSSSISDKLKNDLSGYPLNDCGRILLQQREEGFANPNLTEIQKKSFYDDFLQENVEPHERENIGLQYLFNSSFGFASNNDKIEIHFSHYTIGEKRYTEKQALELDYTYSVDINATFEVRLKETEEIKEQEIFFCDVPYMTEDGTFIINGIERVVVAQIHRSPGVIFDYDARAGLFFSRLIPEKGCWVEFEVSREKVVAKVDRKFKIDLGILLTAIGVITDKEDFLKLFCDTESVKLAGDLEKDKSLIGRYIALDIYDAEKEGKIEKLLYGAGELIEDEKSLKNIYKSGLSEIDLIKKEEVRRNSVLINSVVSYKKMDQYQACDYVYQLLYAIKPSNNNISFEAIAGENSIFFNEKNYYLGDVGRYKINRKFSESIESFSLERSDIVNTVKYLLKVRSSEASLDDIDHLGNRRIRCVGEQLKNYLKYAFVKVVKLAKDRMAVQDHTAILPQNIVSIKPIISSVKDFFATGELSQFMDQTNPLSSITHKRRVSALGPGGLTRERAGFEVRDVHYTHYGRICPIETPEGPNIGLIVSVAFYSNVNEYGFITSPFYEVKDGKVLRNKVKYLSAIEEEKYNVSPNVLVDKSDKIAEEFVSCRKRGDYTIRKNTEVDYMDVSSKQIISVSASLIPFLAHDDANRALMGCNMMRQAVPLLFPESPIVGTGVERFISDQSGFVKIADEDGVVDYADNSSIVVKEKSGSKKKTYDLVKNFRTNQDTFYHQRPIVKSGDKIKKGQIITDGPSIQNKELALGKNIVVAFMTWNGYNYEDAILMSERLKKDDVYTSFHINHYEVESRETKHGSEQVTLDIPGVKEEDKKDLDEDGIIKLGAKVSPGSILVGKITPKGQTEISPEYKLLYSIFGKKVNNVEDSSLRAPHGVYGVVTEIRRYSREERDDIKPGVIQKIKIFIAKERKLKEGDKFAGRHGNKGVISKIVPVQDMPYMEDGTPVDIVLNPLGVPSRMNIGQILEVVLGYVGWKNNIKFATPAFNTINEDNVKKFLKSIGEQEDGKKVLYDGLTGEPFKNRVTVGVMYYLKLSHLVDDKMHARSTGPYSLVTQQPLGGKAQFGGQRVGEMEVWSIEAYGAANILQEFLTVKSDAIDGRTRVYEHIIKGEFISSPTIPESFNVLLNELRGLAINLEVYDEEGEGIYDESNKKLNVRAI